MGRKPKIPTAMFLTHRYENSVMTEWVLQAYDNNTVYSGVGSDALAKQLIELTRMFRITLITCKARVLFQYLKNKIEKSTVTGKNYHLGPIKLRDAQEFDPNCDPDIIGMKEAFKPIWEMCSPEDLPTSVHGIVRRELDQLLTKVTKEESQLVPKWKHETYRKLMRSCWLDATRLRLLELSTRGGLDIVNSDALGIPIDGVLGADLTSSYPDDMVTAEFPLGAGEYFEQFSEELYKDGKGFATLLTLKLKNVQLRDWCLPYIKLLGANGMRAENFTLYDVGSGDNSLIKTAQLCYVVIWDKELELIKDLYDIDSIEWGPAIRYPLGLLPIAFRNYVLDLYKDKSELKGVKGQELKYAASKIKINALAGDMQARPIRCEELALKLNKPELIKNKMLDGFTDEELNQELNESYNIHKTSKDKWPDVFSRHNSYVTGKYLTMLSRVKLMRFVMRLPKNQVIQTATDAVYVKDNHLMRTQIAWYNDEHKKVLGKVSKDFTPEAATRLHANGKYLGFFEVERYACIKVLGVKRYLTQDYEGELTLKHSGLLIDKSLDKLYEEATTKEKNIFKCYTDDFKGITAPSPIYRDEPLRDSSGNILELAYVEYRHISPEEEDVHRRLGIPINA